MASCETVEFANSLHDEFGSLYGFHVLAPFPGTEVRDKAKEYGLEILHSDWEQYDANHVVTRTPGADTDVLQVVIDEYDETMERYLRYQDLLYENDKLEGYEKKMYLRRHRQSLLWKLLLDDVVEGFGALPGEPHAALTEAVSEATGVTAAYAGAEMQRVLELGALVPRTTPEGTVFEWSE